MVARRALLSSISVTMLMGRCCCCDASRALVLMLHPPFLSLMSLSDTVTNNNYDNKNDSGILCLENSALNSRALYTGYCLGCTEWPISDTSTIHPAISPPLLSPPPTFQATAPAPPITNTEETTVKAINKCSNSDMNQRENWKEGELQLTSRLVKKQTLIMAYYYMVSAEPYGNNIDEFEKEESPTVYTQMIFLTLLLVGIASMAAINNNNEEEQVSSTNDSGIPTMKRAKSFTFEQLLDTSTTKYTEEGEEEETPRASEPVSPSQFLGNMLKALNSNNNNKEKKKNTNNNKKEEKTKEKKEQVLKKEKNQKQQQHRRVTVSADSQDYTAKGNEEKENNIILADLLLPSLNRTGTKMKNREDPKKKEEPLKEKKVYGRGGRLIQVV